MLVEIAGLDYYYPEETEPALKGIDLKIEAGEFLLIVGPSGGGKSTFGRALAGLLPNYYGGKLSGDILINSGNINGKQALPLADLVGFVFQDPERQLVTSTVEREIAFGLENLGLNQAEMQLRIAEVLDFLKLEDVRHKRTHLLSGGQQQKICLAAALARRPQLLILDEPTAQLDPGSAEDLFATLRRLNEEWGTTIVLIEHRLERCYHLADRILVINGGQLVNEGPPLQVAWELAASNGPFLPAVTQVFAKSGHRALPLTVKSARSYLHKMQLATEAAHAPVNKSNSSSPRRPVLVELEKVWHTYADGTEALRDCSWQLLASSLTVVLGANGSGKSTLLKHLAGLLRPTRGKIKAHKTQQHLHSEVASVYLGQSSDHFFCADTVNEEINLGYGQALNQQAENMHQLFGVQGLSAKNPRDLSVGERQRVALAILFSAEAQLYLLDEPTRGLDPVWKGYLIEALKLIHQKGKTVVIATHDLDFAAEWAEMGLILSSGRIVANKALPQVLQGALYFNSQIGRMFTGISFVHNKASAIRWMKERGNGQNNR